MQTFEVNEKVNWRFELLVLFPMKNVWSVNSLEFVYLNFDKVGDCSMAFFPELVTLVLRQSVVPQSLRQAPKDS